MLATREVSYQIDGRNLVRDVSLSVPAGSLLGLIGPNGAGKTTLLKLISGDLVPVAGEVLLDGKPLATYSVRELALRRCVLPQASTLTFPFTTRQVVLMGRYPHIDRRGETAHDHAIVSDAIARVAMHDYEERSYPTMSGGEQARANMARALAQATPVLLLDEPASHLDPHYQHHVLALARELADEGATVVVVLHDLNLVAAYADRVGVMAQGRLRALGAPWEVLTEQLLEDVFRLRFRRLQHPELDCPLLVPIART